MASARFGGGVSFIAGTLAPRRYDSVQTLYSVDGLTIVRRFYAGDSFICQVRSTLDDQGREILTKLERSMLDV